MSRSMLAAQGRLRVSVPTVFAHVALGRIGARFAMAYPEVQLEIVAEDRLVDPSMMIMTW